MAEAAARPQFDVRHNEGAKRFEIELAGPDGKPQLAIAEYRMHMGVGAPAGGAVTRSAALQVMEMHHTEVPPAGRGRGVASQLCKAAFQYCHEAGVAVRPSCSYVSDTWLPSHPEYKAMLESELVAPTFRERAAPTPAEAAAALAADGAGGGAAAEDEEEEEDEWGEAAQRNLQGHTFRLARQQYHEQVLALDGGGADGAARAKTLTRLGQLLLNRVLELLPRNADPNVAGATPAPPGPHPRLTHAPLASSCSSHRHPPTPLPSLPSRLRAWGVCVCSGGEAADPRRTAGQRPARGGRGRTGRGGGCGGWGCGWGGADGVRAGACRGGAPTVIHTHLHNTMAGVR